MKTNWQTRKLGEVCDFQNGFAFKSKLFKEAGFPVLRISNIQNDGISYSRLVFFDKKNYKEDFDKYQVLKGDLVIAMSGATTGKLAICDADEIFYLNQRVGKFKPKKDLLNDYLYYFLSTRIEENLKISAGSAQPNLSTGQIKSFEIPLPPLPEQHRIVKILDEVFADVAKAKENAEKNLKNSKELFESYLQSVFANPEKDWEEKRLGDVVATTQGVQIKKSLQIKAPKIGYKRYLYISDFDHEKNLKYVEDIYPKKLVTKDDLIVVNTGASAGKIFRGIDGILSNNLFKVSFSKDILNTDFLYYFVTSSIFRDFQKKIVRGTANPHMGHENFNLTPFNLPKLFQQKSIVAKLDALSAETKKLKAIYRQKLADLEELKKSVLKKAFNGEL